MKLEIKKVRVNKCTFENNMGPNMQINLPISTASQIKLPNEFTKGSVGTVVTKILVGSPMNPLYLYFEQAAFFQDDEATEETKIDHETMMSVFKTVCVPMAMKEVEKTISNLCKTYQIPEIRLEKKTS